jgi:hypothetical protein
MKNELRENIKAIRMVEAATESIILDKKAKFVRIIELCIKDPELYEIILARKTLAKLVDEYNMTILYLQ